jgi:hypothetical protein
MKKIVLAFVALGLAFAISSCCDQGNSSGKCKQKCEPKKEESALLKAPSQEEPVTQNPQPEKVHRKW